MFLRLLNNLVLLRIFAIISMAYSFWIIFRMDEYLPWQVRFFRALELTFIGHVGLWLAAFQWKGKFRFVIAAIFLPTIICLTILWGYLGIFVFAWLGWRMFTLIRGDSNVIETV